MLSQGAADELAPLFAAHHWVEYPDGKQYCEVPPHARGIPHGLTPGVHACLSPMIDGLETLRTQLGRQEASTVDTLMALPFGPFTQALAPTVEPTADLYSIRLCVRDNVHNATATGRAYMPDATHDDDAILREPLFLRPSQTSVSDNPFNTSYEAMDSFFNCAINLALLARSACRGCWDPVPWLHKEIHEWITGPEGAVDELRCLPTFPADACLLLNLMYPCNWTVGENLVLPVWAEAVPAAARATTEAKTDESRRGLYLKELVSSELLQQARTWWAAFSRADSPSYYSWEPETCTSDVHPSSRCAWHAGVAPLLTVLEQQNGSHYVDGVTCAAVRAALENAVQAAWLVHSPDGEQPPPPECPCSTASGPEKVRRPHIDPIFVNDELQGEEARGCLVGVKPHQLRQVLALALGAALPGVEVQACRNEGARPSLCASPAPSHTLAARRRTQPAHQLRGRHCQRGRLGAQRQEHLAGADRGCVRSPRFAAPPLTRGPPARSRRGGLRQPRGQAGRLQEAAQRLGRERAAAVQDAGPRAAAPSQGAPRPRREQRGLDQAEGGHDRPARPAQGDARLRARAPRDGGGCLLGARGRPAVARGDALTARPLIGFWLGGTMNLCCGEVDDPAAAGRTCCHLSLRDVVHVLLVGASLVGALILVATCLSTRAPGPTEEIDTSVECEEGGSGGEDAGAYRDPAPALSDEESPR